jgi:hypothetical protein
MISDKNSLIHLTGEPPHNEEFAKQAKSPASV